MKKWTLLIGFLTYSSVGWSQSITMECGDKNFIKHDPVNKTIETRYNGKWIVFCQSMDWDLTGTDGEKFHLKQYQEVWEMGGSCTNIKTTLDGIKTTNKFFYDFLFPSEKRETYVNDTSNSSLGELTFHKVTDCKKL